RMDRALSENHPTSPAEATRDRAKRPAFHRQHQTLRYVPTRDARDPRGQGTASPETADRNREATGSSTDARARSEPHVCETRPRPTQLAPQENLPSACREDARSTSPHTHRDDSRRESTETDLRATRRSS